MGNAKQVSAPGQRTGCVPVAPTRLPCFNIVGKTAGRLTIAALATAWALVVRIAGWNHWRNKRAAVERRLSAARREATCQATKRLRAIWRPD
eukprot:14979354-Alexandrium_andersonii.AAC.1